mmetsp:Transcript_55777/g.134521  ORF Transcript_55777/g.134521 Transcript_55777/m.134521 type:complete len:142 (+) Transcript_55777:1708-2133(+)
MCGGSAAAFMEGLSEATATLLDAVFGLPGTILPNTSIPYTGIPSIRLPRDSRDCLFDIRLTYVSIAFAPFPIARFFERSSCLSISVPVSNATNSTYKRGTVSASSNSRWQFVIFLLDISDDPLRSRDRAVSSRAFRGAHCQ